MNFISKIKSNKKTAIIVAVAAVCFLVAAAILIKMLLIPDNEDLKEKYVKPSSSKQTSSEEEENAVSPINFTELLAQNEDVCGWITVEDPDENGFSPISYPIMQSSANEPEDFYLTHNLEKKYSFDGSIYIQRYNSSTFADRVTVIYGHDLADGTMFTPLRRFRKADYFNTHDTIHIYRPGHNMTYRIVSAFVYDDRHLLNAFNFYDDNDYTAFINECKSPTSLVRNVRKDIEVTTSDKLIVLSTCTNVETERYLVVAKLVEDTPTTSKDIPATSKVSSGS